MCSKGDTPAVEIIDEVLSQGKLYDFFIGNYRRSFPFNASAPTDDQFVFDCWQAYVDKNVNKQLLWTMFKDIAVRISCDENLSWYALYYLYLFLGSNRRKRIDVVNIQSFIDEIILNVVKQKEKLKNDYRWTAYEKTSFSLWDDSVRMIRIMSREYDFDFHLNEIE